MAGQRLSDRNEGCNPDLLRPKEFRAQAERVPGLGLRVQGVAGLGLNGF